MNQKMTAILRDAYAHPDRRAFFYAANPGETGSERLNGMDCWNWTPSMWQGVPGVSTCTFPLALGATPVRTSEGKEWVQGIITDPAQVKDFEAPDVRSGRTGEVLAECQAVVDGLAEGEQVRCPDIQSPLGVVELLWGKSFYIDLIEHGTAIHDLLEKVTAFIIAFHLELQRIAGDRFNAAGFPVIWSDPVGVYVADDTMSLLSPEMHLEFSVPYLNRMSDACGPLVYHSCSWYPQYFENLHQLTNVKIWNWNPGNSADPEVIIKEFSGTAILGPHLVLEMHADRDVIAMGHGFADEFEFFKYMLDCTQDDTAMYFWFSNIVQKGPIIERIYDLLDERGLTPSARGLV